MKLTKEYKSRASARKHRITVVRDVEVNVSGFLSITPVKTGTYWASVQPLTERMRTQYKTISVTASHAITVAGSLDIRESDKIQFKNRDFDVLTIRDVDENGRDKIVITQETRPGQKAAE